MFPKKLSIISQKLLNFLVRIVRFSCKNHLISLKNLQIFLQKTLNVTIATETRLSARNLFFFFFFFVGKNLFLHMVMKKVADRGFLAFWPFENERKFRRNRKNAAKNLIFGKKWVSTTTGTSIKPWSVRTYHHHTRYYADHQFPIINTNRFVIHNCEFYLFLNRTAPFICIMTNLSPMRKLSLFQTLRNYNFIASTIASVRRHRVYES